MKKKVFPTDKVTKVMHNKFFMAGKKIKTLGTKAYNISEELRL
jgi:hypothetical protein